MPPRFRFTSRSAIRSCSAFRQGAWLGRQLPTGGVLEDKIYLSPSSRCTYFFCKEGILHLQRLCRSDATRIYNQIRDSLRCRAIIFLFSFNCLLPHPLKHGVYGYCEMARKQYLGLSPCQSGQMRFTDTTILEKHD